MKGRLFLLAALCFPLAAVHAQTPTPLDSCFKNAATQYGVNKSVLLAIAKTESNLNPNAISPLNANGTYDIGMMQINSSWLSRLKSLGISEVALKQGCTNIFVGAWILASNISQHGATWKAVGAYNARSENKQTIYAQKVQQNYLAMLQHSDLTPQ